MNEKTFDGIQRKYEEMNDENNKLYNQVRGLIDDCDNLKEMKDALKNDIKLHEESKKKVWSMRDDVAQYFEKCKDEVLGKIKFYEEKKKSQKEVIDSIKIGIPIIFERIGCQMSQKDELELMKLNDENIVTYLEQIEKKTNEILKLYEKHQQREAVDNVNLEKDVDPQVKKEKQIADTENQAMGFEEVFDEEFNTTWKTLVNKMLNPDAGMNSYRQYTKMIYEKKVKKNAPRKYQYTPKVGPTIYREVKRELINKLEEEKKQNKLISK